MERCNEAMFVVLRWDQWLKTLDCIMNLLVENPIFCSRLSHNLRPLKGEDHCAISAVKNFTLVNHWRPCRYEWASSAHIRRGSAFGEPVQQKFTRYFPLLRRFSFPTEVSRSTAGVSQLTCWLILIEKSTGWIHHHSVVTWYKAVAARWYRDFGHH